MTKQPENNFYRLISAIEFLSLVLLYGLHPAVMGSSVVG
jgi:hypothetical protein